MENAFGILANRFQVMLTTMQHQAATVKTLIKACIVLHNLMRMRYPGLQNQQVDRPEGLNTVYIPGAWREGVNLEDTHVVAGNTATRQGKKQRNLLKHWVNSPAGSVPWQDKMV